MRYSRIYFIGDTVSNVIDLTDVLPELVGGKLAQFVKFDLLGENIEGNVDWPAKSTTALIVIKYRIEGRPIPVEEVFVAKRIEISKPPCRIAKQRVRKLV